MRLTKHRRTFNLEMSAEELVFLVNHLGSDPQTTEDQEKVTEYLKELTHFQRFYEAYDRYLEEEITRITKLPTKLYPKDILGEISATFVILEMVFVGVPKVKATKLQLSIKPSLNSSKTHHEIHHRHR
jgi:hypothetical protein